MPITLSYEPAAAAVGYAGLLGGEGSYQKWLNQFLQNQYQFGVNTQLQEQQMAMQRMNALSQIAAQAQQQQGQQQFEAQMLPYRSQLDAQNQAYQSQLQQGNNAASQILGSQLQQQQSTQDFGEAQQLAAQRAQQELDQQQAVQQAQQERQQNVAQFNSQLQQQQQVEQLWQNPLATHLKNAQSAQQQGYQFTPQQETQRQALMNNIQGMQNDVSSGRTARGELMGQMQSNVQQLNAIVPTYKPPTTADIISQKVQFGYPEPDPNNKGQMRIRPGTEDVAFTVDNKGTPMVVRGYKAPEPGDEVVGEDGRIISEKTRGVMLSNQLKERKVNLDRSKYVRSEMTSMMRANPMLAYDPNAQAQLKQQLEQEYDQASGMTPSGALPVSPGQVPQGQGQPQGQPPATPTHMGTYGGVTAEPPQQPQPQQAPQQPQQPPSPQQQLQQAQQIYQQLAPHFANWRNWSPEQKRLYIEARRVLEMASSGQAA